MTTAPEDAVRFDHTAPEIAGPEFWDAIGELRAHGPLVWVEDHGGYWAALGYDVVRQAAQDWKTFSSAQGTAIERPSPDQMPYIMPIDIDPPRQVTYRRKVNPYLTPTVLAHLEDGIRGIADELIDNFVEEGTCDLAADFARRLPGTVFFRLLVGADDEDFREVEPWARTISFDPDPVKKGEAAARLNGWVGTLFRDRAAQPRSSDVVDAVMHLGDSGEAFAPHELQTGLALLAMGGIGTSSDLIGSIACVLCDHPELQERVRSDLDLVPALVEECLRLEPPVTMMFRTATGDVDLAGRHIAEGDKVGLFFAAANRDPAMFDRPDEVDINRKRNPHVAFGMGVHRCIGSNLARLQVRVAVEQMLARLSPFWIPDGARVEYVCDQERGPSSIPLVFRAGPKARAGASQDQGGKKWAG